MNFLFYNLTRSTRVSRDTFKLSLALPPLDMIIMTNLARAAGHQARIFDDAVDHPDTLAALVSWADWIVVQTTHYHMWQCPSANWPRLVPALRSLPLHKLIICGLQPTLFPKPALQQSGARAAIRQEPETVLAEFLKQQDWAAIPGVSRLENGCVVDNPLPRLLHMNDLAVKDYDVDISKYSYFLLGRRAGIFEASRGCPWRCTFCNQGMFGHTYRRKDPALFAEEVDAAVKKTDMRCAYFFDLEFTLSKRHTLEICEQLQRRGIHRKLKWCCQTRADTVDAEMLGVMKQAGCTLIHYGVESANPAVLEKTNKKLDWAKAREGIQLTKSLGIQTACFFMFGLPEEDASEFDKTLELARDINPTYASFHFAIPFPGTELHRHYLCKTGQSPESWPPAFFDDWSAKQRSAFIKRAFIKFYLFPKRLELWELRCRLQNLPLKIAYFKSILTSRQND